MRKPLKALLCIVCIRSGARSSAASLPNAQQSGAADKGFSFAVYGDSRSMMYLPYKQDEEAQARELMVDMFELVLPAESGARGGRRRTSS